MPSGDCAAHLERRLAVGGRAGGRVAGRAVDRPAQLRVPHRRHRAVVARRHPGVSAIGPGAERPEDRADGDDPARRHGRLLRVGRAARPARAAGPAGGGRRRRRPGRGGRRVLRGPGLRRALGDAVGAGPPAVPAGGVPRRAPRPLRRGERPGHGDLPRRHPAGRAAVARRGVPRRRRRACAGSGRRRGSPPTSASGCSPRRASPARSAWPAPSSWPSWPPRRPSPRPRPPGPASGRVWRWSSPADTLAFLRPLPVQALWGVGPGHARQARAPGRRDRRRPGRPAGGQPRRRPRAQPGPPPARARQRPRPAGGRARAEDEVDRPRGDLRPRPPPALRPSSGSWCGFADAVAARLRAQGVVGRTVQIKVRFGDFRTITRSSSLAVAVDDAPIAAARGPGPARPGRSRPGRAPARAVGERPGRGAAPASSPSTTRSEGPGLGRRPSRTVDEIRARFGSDAIGPAVLGGPDGLRVKGRHRQQWGPGGSSPGEEPGTDGGEGPGDGRDRGPDQGEEV